MDVDNSSAISASEDLDVDAMLQMLGSTSVSTTEPIRGQANAVPDDEKGTGTIFNTSCFSNEFHLPISNIFFLYL